MTSCRAYLNRNTGRWQAIVELGRDERGKRKQRFKNTPREKNTKAEARRVARQILNEYEAGTYVEPSELVLSTYLESWLSDVARHRVADRTYDRYRIIVRHHLVPALGQVKLDALRPDQVQHFYGRLSDQGLAPSTVQKVHAVLHSALKHAVRMRLLVRNPSDDLSLPKIRRPEIRALTDKEIARLLATAKDTSVAVPLLCLLTIGVRRGELLGLRWSDVELEAGVLSVRRSLEESSSGAVLKEPKTAKGSRTIALPEVTIEALREHRKAQCELRVRVGPAYNSGELVFPGADGEPWWPSNFGRACRRVMKKAKLDCRLHDLRHTHATMLLRQGVHPKVVQERLGHANIGITLDIYSHVAPHMQEEAAAKIDAGLRAALG